MTTVDLPNGDTIQFPDDTPNDTILKVVKQHVGASGSAAQPATGLKRSAGLAARTGIEGLLGGVTGLPNFIANLGSGLLTGNYNRFRNPGVDIANAIGLPTPESNEEKMAHAAGSGAIEMGTPAGMLNSAFKAGKALSQAAPALSRFLTDAPRMQMASGAGAGAASELANQNDASPGMRAAYGVAGGLLPVFAAPAARLGTNTLSHALGDVRDIVRTFTENGRRQIAGRVLNDAAGPYASQIAGMDNAALAPLIPGSDPTLGQVANNGGISSLEKIAASRGVNSGKFADRRMQQREAQQALANEVGDAASARLNTDRQTLADRMPAGMGASEAGPILREHYNQNYQAAREGVNRNYQSVDPEGTARFSLGPLLDKFDASLGTSPIERDLMPAQAKNFYNTVGAYAQTGTPATWRDLQAMRSELGDLGYQSAVSGDRKTGRIADAMKRNIDDYIREASGEPVEMPPTKKDYEAARREALDIMAADPMTEDFGWIRNLGLDRQAAERLLSKDQVREMSRKFPGMFRNGGRRITDLSEATLAKLGGHSGAPLDEGAVMERLEDLVNNGDMRVRPRLDALTNDLLGGRRPNIASGLTPDGVKNLLMARMSRRALGENFEQGANLPLSRKGSKLYGGAIDSSAIPGNYFRKGPAGGEAMDAFNRAFYKDPEARDALTGYAQNVARNAAIDKNGNLSPYNLARFRQNYENALRYMPEVNNDLQMLETAGRGLSDREAAFRQTLRKSGDNYALQRGVNLGGSDRSPYENGTSAFTPEEYDNLRALQADMGRVTRNDQLGATSGSPTARNLYGQGRLGNTITPMFSKIPLIGPSFDRILDNRNTAVFNEVERGLLSPMYGVNLMRNAASHRLEYPNAEEFFRGIGNNMARGSAGGYLLGYMRQGRKKKKEK